MIASQPRDEILRFGVFELDVSAGELRKNGVRVKLQQQPFQILVCLLEHSGNVVPREDLIERLWPNGTVVEYEHSLGTAVNKIRQALDDSADNPRFVETLPRRGYRFLLPVERIARPAEARPQEVAESPTPQAGGSISRYRIIDKIGQGGMGVVYKAEDTKLERPVALKFLAAHAVEDPEHKSRFIREAKAAARLDHPNICSVYEIDEADGRTFLAMAYLEGQTVKEKVQERPLKLDEAIDIAIQTAQGLQAAHQKSVIHRDIKSANLMITAQGRLKIMDFGLAQLADRTKLTQAAALLGTPAYMSPEQAQRQPTDHRTDIWSLGVVIYEMLTGHLPFEGEREQAVLLAITNEEPEPVTALRSRLPAEIDRILEKALAKNPEERYQNVADMLVDLRRLEKKHESGKSVAARRVPASAADRSDRRQRLRRIALAAGTAVAGLALGIVVTLLIHAPDSTPEAPVRKFSFAPSEPSAAAEAYYAISLNGQHIVWAAGSPERRLWIRDIGQEDQRVIAGTEGARGPFWSPDSQFIGFGTASELRKIAVQGGAAVTLCELPGKYFMGGAWNPDGSSIVFSAGDRVRLYEVAALGGTPEILLEKEPATAFNMMPHFLPVRSGPPSLAFSRGDFTLGFETVVRNLATNEEQLLGPGIGPVYSPTGHLLFMTNANKAGLWALPFSPENLEVEGEAFPIARNAFLPSVAADGTLVYGDFFTTGQEQLVWRDREGNNLGEIGQPQDRIRQLELSPDGRQVAVSGEEEDGNLDIWIHEVNRPLRTRLTSSDENDSLPTWLPSGDAISFSSGPPGTTRDRTLYVRRADGSSSAEPLLAGATNEGWITDWSSDGMVALLIRRGQKEAGYDLWYLKRKDDGEGYESVPFVETEFSGFGGGARFSPGHRWVVYPSDESGQLEVYVRSFPDGAGKKQVSVRGGSQPRWSRDGKTIFYVEEASLMAVSVVTGPEVSIGTPLKLFESNRLRWSLRRNLNYDVSADGQRFVVIEPVEVKGADPRAHVVQNWFAEFQDRERD